MEAQETRDTKERILDAAERLFAQQGFDAASLRGITSEADVNLAAVHYHFGSKEALIAAVFSRRTRPINRERLELLDALEAGDADPTVEQIVEAFVRPPLRFFQEHEGEAVLRVLGHAMNQPDEAVRALFIDQFRVVFERFATALVQVLPNVPPTEMIWRCLFMVGAMAYTMSMARDVERISMGAINPSDVDSMVGHLVPFVVAGLQAPLPGEGGA